MCSSRSTSTIFAFSILCSPPDKGVAGLGAATAANGVVSAVGGFGENLALGSSATGLEMTCKDDLP